MADAVVITYTASGTTGTARAPEGMRVAADDDGRLAVTTTAGGTRTVRVVRFDEDRLELDVGDVAAGGTCGDIIL